MALRSFKIWAAVLGVGLVLGGRYAAAENQSKSPNDMVGGFVEGNQLYASCRSNNPIACDSYIMGVADAMSGHDVIYKWRACIPLNVRVQQVHDVVVKYLEANPAIRQNLGITLVADALTSAWPCPANK
jgi:hypothetical protein